MSRRRPALALALTGAVLALAGTSGPRREAAAGVERIRFVDVSRAAGLSHTGPSYDAAVGDFDGDGRPDLYVGNHGSGAVLMRNLGGGRFADVLPGSGLARFGDQHGAAWGDYDNDGRLDLYVSLGADRGHGEKRNRLYHNDGGGRFHDVGEAAGVSDPRGRSRSVAWLDVDGDGWLDLLVADFATPSRLYRNQRDGSFRDVSDAYGISAFEATHLAWADVDGDGYPDLALSGTRKGLRLLHNDGGRRFEDATRRTGLGRVDEPVQGMAFGDYDGDGWLDLFFDRGSDFDEVRQRAGEQVSFAFYARQEQTGFDFRARSIEAQLYENGLPAAASRLHCGSSVASDPGRLACSAEAASRHPASDGGEGFQLWSEPGPERACPGCPESFRWHLRWSGAGDHHLSGLVRGASQPVEVGFRPRPGSGGELYRGRGDGSFVPSGLGTFAATGEGQAVQWADADDDGWLDLYVVSSGEEGPSGDDHLFLNDGAGGFTEVPPSRGASPPVEDGRGAGAHFFDFDGDGRLDLFLTNGWGAPPFDRGPYRLLENRSAAGHWIALELTGRRSNREGLGARIELLACGRSQVRYHNGSGYFSQSDVPPHFGLGRCAAVDVLRVRWPAGGVDELHHLAVDRRLQLVEGSSPAPLR